MSRKSFKVIGADGAEYAADGLDELRSWVGDGRVGRETMVWSPEDGLWRRAAERPELRWDLPESPPVIGAPPTAGTGEPEARPCPAAGAPAGIGARLAAGTLDLVVALLLFNLASIPWADELRAMQAQVAAEASKAVPDMGLMLRANGVFFGAFLLLRMLYTGVFHAVVGATPGKLAFGLRLVAMDGGAPGALRVLLRTILENLTLATLGVGFGVMMLGGDGRALHDLLAGTRVTSRHA